MCSTLIDRIELVNTIANVLGREVALLDRAQDLEFWRRMDRTVNEAASQYQDIKCHTSTSRIELLRITIAFRERKATLQGNAQKVIFWRHMQGIVHEKERRMSQNSSGY